MISHSQFVTMTLLLIGPFLDLPAILRCTIEVDFTIGRDSLICICFRSRNLLSIITSTRQQKTFLLLFKYSSSSLLWKRNNIRDYKVPLLNLSNSKINLNAWQYVKNGYRYMDLIYLFNEILSRLLCISYENLISWIASFSELHFPYFRNRQHVYNRFA